MFSGLQKICKNIFKFVDLLMLYRNCETFFNYTPDNYSICGLLFYTVFFCRAFVIFCFPIFPKAAETLFLLIQINIRIANVCHALFWDVLKWGISLWHGILRDGTISDRSLGDDILYC
jgi:hypothetical protein